MASVAGRKKSILANPGIVIETAPIANNTLLNKSASQSTSLYQQCSSLRSRLIRVHGFSQFFTLSSQSESLRQSTDPVTQLWDCFALGIPLCYIFNLLPPPVIPIDVNTDPASFDITNERAKKRAIALFAMQIKQVEGCEQFTVTDLWNRESTDGLVKVINTVIKIVDQLPHEMFEEAVSSPPTLSSRDSTDSLDPDTQSAAIPGDAKEAARANIIREIVETERKYVQDLEVMQKYSAALSQSNTISQDTIHLLFPGLNKLLNFQRKFLIRLESTAELPWKEQRWGLHFIENEEEFVVYEPYCANYTNAAEIMLAEEQNLLAFNHLVDAKAELPAFLIKPVQRICKYPLLLDSLIKASSPPDYPFHEELQAGSAAAKRITDKINEAQRRAENLQTVQNLEGRIKDWKGHNISNFGDLLLDDVFIVTKSEVDREYHVFLFEKIILCCKEALQAPPNGKKNGKNGSILKKQTVTTSPAVMPGGPLKKKDTPLLLKGRIFLNNVTQAVPTSPRNSIGSSIPSQYSLAVWWRGDDDLEYFTLRCRTEEQLRQWETQINRLIQEVATRRVSERSLSQLIAQSTNPPKPATRTRQSSTPYIRDRISSAMSHLQYPNGLPPHPASSRGQHVSAYSSEEQISSSSAPYTGNGAAVYLSDGFEFELDDDFEDYPPTSCLPPSGRETPLGSRRVNAQSLPAERIGQSHINDRWRPNTEDAHGHVMAQIRTTLPPPLPPPALRPMTQRLNSNTSGSSALSDASFGTGVRPSRMPLHSQFSSARLHSAYTSAESYSNQTAPSPQGASIPPLNRSRSASQPSAFVPTKTVPPPLPSVVPWSNGTKSSHKRGSGSSQSTGDSSEDSPNSSSPVTPFGSSESSLAGSTLRSSRSQHFEAVASDAAHLALSSPVKVKVHFNEDIFVIQVPRTTEYSDLVEKVGRKIRLCGPVREDAPLRVKYKDEDGDMVSLGSTEDVQIAFESYRPGGQVTLYVT